MHQFIGGIGQPHDFVSLIVTGAGSDLVPSHVNDRDLSIAVPADMQRISQLKVDLHFYLFSYPKAMLLSRLIAFFSVGNPRLE